MNPSTPVCVVLFFTQKQSAQAQQDQAGRFGDGGGRQDDVVEQGISA